MIRQALQARCKVAEERGAVLVVTILVMTSLLVFAGYAIDTAIWFVHHRHLQTEADAAALAAGQNFQFGCGSSGDATIQSIVHQYDGTGLTPTLTPTYNTQVSNTVAPALTASSTQPTAGHVLYSGLNQANYPPAAPYQTVPNDTGLTGSPCTDNVIDVKMTEQGLQSFFPFVNPTYINAQARVGFQVAATSTSGLPFVEPLPTPGAVAVEFVNENTGAVLTPTGSATPYVILSEAKDSAGNLDPTTWTARTPLSFADPANGGSTSDTFPLGMRVAVNNTAGGSATFACTTTDTCYDDSSATSNTGVTFTRVWSNSGSPGLPLANPVAPQASDVWLQPCTASGTSCTACPTSPNPSYSNFFASSTNTTEQLCANMQFTSPLTGATTGTALTCANTSLTVTGGGAPTMTCPNPPSGSANGTWSSGPLTVPAFIPDPTGNTPGTNNGAMNIGLSWGVTAGCLPVGATGGKTDSSGFCTQGASHMVCATGGGNACVGSFDGKSAATPETVQQAYSGAYSLTSGLSVGNGGTGPSNSGTIAAASLTDLTGNEIQSIANGTNFVSTNTNPADLAANVTVHFYGFETTTSFTSPPIELTLGGNQGNGDLGCAGNNGKTGFDGAIEAGCSGNYAPTSIQPWTAACPNGSTNATPGPATCLSTNPGGGKSKSIADALNVKVDGGNTPCTSPNHWSAANNNTVGAILSQSPPDPRLVEIFYTDNITLPGGSGTDVPIRGFAEFYITGWGSGGGSSKADPCLTVANGGSWNPASPPVCTGSLPCTPDDLPPDNTDGVVMGHFVTYVQTLGNGNGQTCTVGTLNVCVPVLTK